MVKLPKPLCYCDYGDNVCGQYRKSLVEDPLRKERTCPVGKVCGGENQYSCQAGSGCRGELTLENGGEEYATVPENGVARGECCCNNNDGMSCANTQQNHPSEDRVGSLGCLMPLCPPGTWQHAGNARSCYYCAPNTYSGSTWGRKSACTSTAPAGTVAPEGSAMYTVCQAGTFANKNTHVCQSCAAGTFSPASRAVSCTPCDAGHYSAGSATRCLQCAPGTFTTDKRSCSPCPPGSHANSAQDGCDLCASGYYMPDESATTCWRAPPNSITNGTGATSYSYCPAGTFVNATSSACQQNPVGWWSPPNASKAEPCLPSTFFNSTTLQCQLCPVGWTSWLAELQCRPTPPGFYSTLADRPGSDNSTWRRCPLPFVSTKNGTVGQCTETCGAGFVPARPVPSFCAPCPENYFAPEPRMPHCRVCPNASTTNGRTGSDRCHKCQPFAQMTTAFPGGPCVTRASLGLRDLTLSEELSASLTPSLSAAATESVAPTRTVSAAVTEGTPTADSRSLRHSPTHSRGTPTDSRRDSITRSFTYLPVKFVSTFAKAVPSQAKIAAAAIAAATMIPSYAIMGRRAIAVGGLADCGNADPHEPARLGWDSNPLGLNLQSGDNDKFGEFKGSLVSVLVVVLGWLAVVAAVALVRAAVVKGTTVAKELRFVRFPSTMYVPLCVFFPAAVTSLGALFRQWQRDPESKPQVAIVGTGFLVFMFIPTCWVLWVCFMVYNHERMTTETKGFNSDEFKVRPISTVVFYVFKQRREWRETKFLSHHGAIYDNAGTPIYVVLSFIAILTISLSAGLSSQCSKDDPPTCCSRPIIVGTVAGLADLLFISAWFFKKGFSSIFLIRFEAVVIGGCVFLTSFAVLTVCIDHFTDGAVSFLEPIMGGVNAACFYCSIAGAVSAAIGELLPVLEGAKGLLKDKVIDKIIKADKRSNSSEEIAECGGGDEELLLVGDSAAAADANASSPLHDAAAAVPIVVAGGAVATAMMQSASRRKRSKSANSNKEGEDESAALTSSPNKRSDSKSPHTLAEMMQQDAATDAGDLPPNNHGSMGRARRSSSRSKHHPQQTDEELALSLLHHPSPRNSSFSPRSPRTPTTPQQHNSKPLTLAEERRMLAERESNDREKSRRRLKYFAEAAAAAASPKSSSSKPASPTTKVTRAKPDLKSTALL